MSKEIMIEILRSIGYYKKVMKKDIKRAIIEMTVERGLREINEDPRRSIRKLADYGKQFGKGRFMQEIHAHYQDLLRNDESPYYSAIELILKHTSMRALKDFGINLGYNSLTKGGKIARKAIEKNGFMIPWNIYISLDSESDKSLSPHDLIPVIARCRKLGIFTFVLELVNDLTYMESAISLFNMYDDCAFMLLLPDCELSEETADKLMLVTNVLSFVNVSGVNNYSNALLLKSRKIWYGTYDKYNEDSFKDIPIEEKIKDHIEFESPFVLLAAEDGTSTDCIFDNSNAVKKTRLEPKYPLFTFDLWGDSLKINDLVSGTKCFVHVTDSGIIHTNTKDLTFTNNAFDIESVLKEAFTL